MTGAAALTGQAVLTLPLGVGVSEDVAAEWRAVMGGWKSINGYSGYTPAYYAPLSLGLRERNGAILTTFRRLMPLHIDVSADDAGGWRTWTTTTFNAPPLVVESGGRAVYRVSRLEGAARPQGKPIPFETSMASCDTGNVGLMNDGALDSRWHCGPDETSRQIVVDLRNVHNVSGIGHAMGIFSNGAPARLSVELSLDGNAWRQAWSGWTLAEAVRAALEDPRRAELLSWFDPMAARFVRLRQVGEESGREWSIVELRVFEPS